MPGRRQIPSQRLAPNPSRIPSVCRRILSFLPLPNDQCLHLSSARVRIRARCSEDRIARIGLFPCLCGCPDSHWRPSRPLWPATCPRRVTGHGGRRDVSVRYRDGIFGTASWPCLDRTWGCSLIDGWAQGYCDLVSEGADRARQWLHDHAGVAWSRHRNGANRLGIGLDRLAKSFRTADLCNDRHSRRHLFRRARKCHQFSSFDNFPAATYLVVGLFRRTFPENCAPFGSLHRLVMGPPIAVGCALARGCRRA